jgi:predicted nucleotidyltransferase
MLYQASDFKSRDGLRKHVIEVFSAQDEVYKIGVFGREADGKQDCYSDLDILVFSNDLAGTKASYRQLFSSISPIRAVIQLEPHPGGYSEMLQLVDYSPYQKVDFSIVSEGMCSWHHRVVYENQSKPKISSTRLENPSIIRDVSYMITEVMFSVARFTKCLFRHDIDMYRRWSKISTDALSLLYEKHFGWQSETDNDKMGSSGINRLYADLDDHELQWVNSIRPSDGKVDISVSYQKSIQLLIELSRQKAEYYGIKLDNDFIEFISQFMDIELVRYREQQLPISTLS